MLMKLFFIALAGSLGTLSRYGLAGLVQRSSQGTFPWGTLVVNMIGCLLFGFFWALFENRVALSGDVRAIVLIGFMGAFTTFSSFVFDTQTLIHDSEWILAIVNVVSQNVVGVVFLVAGLMIGKLV